MAGAARAGGRFRGLLLPVLANVVCVLALLQAGLLVGGAGAQAAAAAHAVTHHYKWKAEYVYWSPDCVESVIIAVNGQYPAPTIRVRAGDTVVVELENALPTEGLAIHWHGMLQRGTPWADGATYISQCPINPGETFIYKFVASEAGTFLYHGHFGLQRSAGFYGSLIVLPAHGAPPEPFHYDEELSIIVNDWWHRNIYDQSAGLFSDPFRFVGEPQSLLIEGRGAYNCSLVPQGAVAGSGDAVSCNATRPQCAPYVLSVVPGKTYRLRIASAASLSSLNFVLEGHKLTLVEADGAYVEPVLLDNLDIYSGQTYSVLFTASQPATRNYWAAINVRGRNPRTPPGLAILNYLPLPSTALPPTPPPTSPAWNDFAYSANQAKHIVARTGHSIPPPPQADRKLVLLTSQNRVDGIIKWAVNNISYHPPATPVLAALKYKLRRAFHPAPPPDVYDLSGYNVSAPPSNPNASRGDGVYRFKLGSVVDVVVQNVNTLTPGVSEIHPWHLHGHNFWVLGYGDGAFDAARDEPGYNLRNPAYRNTVAVFPYGWVAIRFVADNPGAWPFHCHVEAHFHMGMGVVFAEGVDRIPTLPVSTLGCGLTKKLIKP